MDAGSPLFMFALLAIMMLVLIVLPARRSKKMQEQLKERQNQMAPGTRVMTNFGLYGTVARIDREANVAELEIAPGTVIKVHLMTVTQIEDQPTSPEAAAEQAPSTGQPQTPVITGEVADEPGK